MSRLTNKASSIMTANNCQDDDVVDSKTTNVIGIVLAGGQSSRMKVDKSTLCINKVSNLQRGINLLKSVGLDDVVVSGNAPGQIYDIYKRGGPLSGILSVIDAKSRDNSSQKISAVLVIPVDMPLLDTQTLSLVLSQGIQHNSACCFDAHSLPIYLPITDQLIDFLTNEFSSDRFVKYNKGPSFRHLLKLIGCHTITPPQSTILSNANTPQQWQAIKSDFIS